MSYTLEDAAGLVEKYIEEHHLPTQVIFKTEELARGGSTCFDVVTTNYLFYVSADT